MLCHHLMELRLLMSKEVDPVTDEKSLKLKAGDDEESEQQSEPDLMLMMHNLMFLLMVVEERFDETESVTDEALAQALETLVDDNAKEWVYLTLPKVLISMKIIVPHKEVQDNLHNSFMMCSLLHDMQTMNIIRSTF